MPSSTPSWPKLRKKPVQSATPSKKIPTQLLPEGIFSNSTAPNATAIWLKAARKAQACVVEQVQNAEPGAIFWILTNGVVWRGMPVWSKLPEPQRWQLVTYIKSLGVAEGTPLSTPVAEIALTCCYGVAFAASLRIIASRTPPSAMRFSATGAAFS